MEARCLVGVALRPWPSIFLWLRLEPHLSPSWDRRGYNSPKRSRFLVDLRTWYLGGRGSRVGTLSCRWLQVDRPCSPMRGLPLYRSGTCTRHSVPMLPGNVAWRVPHCCTKLAEWTTEARVLLISSCWILLCKSSCFCLCSCCFAAGNGRWLSSFSILAGAWNTRVGAMEHSGALTACCYFSIRSFRPRLACVYHLLSPIPATPAWLMRCVNKWASSVVRRWWKGQPTVRCDLQRGCDTCCKSAAVRCLSLTFCMCWISLQGAFWEKKRKKKIGN